jgi:uncharacterized membrane protein
MASKHHEGHEHLHGAFGQDVFGQSAEKIARFFGTPGYILGQSIIVVIWVALNAFFLTGVLKFDPYPFILLNLAFSTQAAYAAPLILLAQTRQADREKAQEDAASEHREEIARMQAEELKHNTELTQAIYELSSKVEAIARGLDQRLP